MKKFKQVAQVVLLAALIFAFLFVFAWIQDQRGCPITQPNCVYVVQQK